MGFLFTKTIQGKILRNSRLNIFYFLTKLLSRFLLPNHKGEPAFETDEHIDLSQLERNLKLSPERRLIEHQAALDLCDELASAGRRLYEQPQ